VPANGGALLGVCNAADAGDGQCLDLPFTNGAPGVCTRTGTLVTGARCDYYLPGTGTDAICKGGDVCFVSALDGRTSRCLPVCDSTHSCQANQVCLAALPPVEPPPLSGLTISIAFGGCVDRCVVGDGGCASGFSCREGPTGVGGICDND
jgi:hypothetical protein